MQRDLGDMHPRSVLLSRVVATFLTQEACSAACWQQRRRRMIPLFWQQTTSLRASSEMMTSNYCELGISGFWIWCEVLAAMEIELPRLLTITWTRWGCKVRESWGKFCNFKKEFSLKAHLDVPFLCCSLELHSDSCELRWVLQLRNIFAQWNWIFLPSCRGDLQFPRMIFLTSKWTSYFSNLLQKMEIFLHVGGPFVRPRRGVNFQSFINPKHNSICFQQIKFRRGGSQIFHCALSVLRFLGEGSARCPEVIKADLLL